MPKSPLYTRPKITVFDVTSGTVNRYFLQQISTKQIIEVDKNQFDFFKNDSLYMKVELAWVIGGNANDIRTKSGTVVFGASHKNTVSTNFYNVRMSGLSRVLSNPLEYFQGIYNTSRDYLIQNQTDTQNPPTIIVPPTTTSTTTTSTTSTTTAAPTTTTTSTTEAPTTTTTTSTTTAAPTTTTTSTTEAPTTTTTTSTTTAAPTTTTTSTTTTSTTEAPTTTTTTSTTEAPTTTTSTTTTSTTTTTTSTTEAPTTTTSTTTTSTTTTTTTEAPNQPDYWWRADSGLTTSSWTAYKGGYDFTLSNVTTASAETGAVFQGSVGFGLSSYLSSDIAATHVLMRIDSLPTASIQTNDTLLGSTQDLIAELGAYIPGGGFNWYIVDDPSDAAALRYAARTTTNINVPSVTALWFNFESGSAPLVYTDNNDTIKATFSVYSGTYNNRFTWTSGSAIYLARRRSTSAGAGYMPVRVKELAIFTSSRTYAEIDAFRDEMLARWP